jgi:hypothetical protein
MTKVGSDSSGPKTPDRRSVREGDEAAPDSETSRRQAQAPAGEIGSGLLSGAWRDETLRKADELQALADWVYCQDDPPPGVAQYMGAIENHLARGRIEAQRPDGRPWVTRLISPADRSAVDSALGNLDAAEASVLRIAPVAQLTGQMPSVEAQVYRYLPKADPRRRVVEDLAHESRQRPPLDEAARDPIVTAYHAAAAQRRRELSRVASFTSVLVVATVFLFVVAVLLAVGGIFSPRAIPLCFHPEDQAKIVCPLAETPADDKGAPLKGKGKGGDLDDGLNVTVRRGDVLIVEAVGMLAAVLALVATLRRMRGTSTPYSLPLAAAVLKLPAGAVTAVLGLLFMRGGFVPGLSALDSSAQILAWAVVFGYAQQLFTGMVDRQANTVLNDVAGRGAAGDRQTSTA